MVNGKIKSITIERKKVCLFIIFYSLFFRLQKHGLPALYFAVNYYLLFFLIFIFQAQKHELLALEAHVSEDMVNGIISKY
jgi:hypothetical protein